MEKQLPFLSYAALFTVCQYAGIAFVNWSLDPGTWPIGWRIACVFLPLALLFGASIASVQTAQSYATESDNCGA